MATKFDSTVLPSNNTDALFRAWATFIHDTIVTTGGWTNTADTGQINLSTATTSAVANTKIGYKIYAMADSLQATNPVYVRIDFGTGATANNPTVWVTIGTGSNGSGTITGKVYDGGATTTGNFATGANSTTGSRNSYGSASTNRFSIAMFVSTSNNNILSFTLERSKDTSGADTGTAVLLYGAATSSSYDVSRYIILAGGSQPANEAGLQFILSSQNPTTFNSVTSIGLAIPMADGAKQPGMNVAITRSSDFTAETQFSVSIYGSTRTFQLLNAMTVVPAANTSGGASSTTRVAIRYD